MFDFQESKREERKKLADEDAQIKIKKLEEQAYTLQRQVASQKQVSTKFETFKFAEATQTRGKEPLTVEKKENN